MKLKVMNEAGGCKVQVQVVKTKKLDEEKGRPDHQHQSRSHQQHENGGGQRERLNRLAELRFLLLSRAGRALARYQVQGRRGRQGRQGSPGTSRILQRAPGSGSGPC